MKLNSVIIWWIGRQIVMMFGLDLGVGGLFLACTSGQSPYYVPIKEKKNLFKRWFTGRWADVANT